MAVTLVVAVARGVRTVLLLPHTFVYVEGEGQQPHRHGPVSVHATSDVYGPDVDGSGVLVAVPRFQQAYILPPASRIRSLLNDRGLLSGEGDTRSVRAGSRRVLRENATIISVLPITCQALMLPPRDKKSRSRAAFHLGKPGI